MARNARPRSTSALSRAVFVGTAVVAVIPPGCGGGGHSGPPSPVVTMNLSPSGIAPGESAILSWSSTNASTCSASGAWTGSQPISGSLGVSPPAPGAYTYTLGCSSSGSSAATESATLTVTPLPLAFVTTQLYSGVIGTSYDNVIQATGGFAPFVWTVSDGALPHNLSLGTSTTNTVTLSGIPDTVAQGVAFTIRVKDSFGQVATQAYSVSILLPADSLVLSPGNLYFGGGLVGSTSGALPETLTNTATSPVVINGISIAGSSKATEFNQTTTCGPTLAAGASCNINVTFTPAQVGARYAVLTIADDTAGSPQGGSLNGVGMTVGPNATPSVGNLGFNTQLVGTTSPAISVELNNYGTATVNIVQIAATASFAETDNCVPSLASGSTCKINVTFTPGAAGETSGVLSISDDAPGSPQRVSLSGTGSTSTPSLTGACWGGVSQTTQCGIAQDFGQCPVGQSANTPTTTSGCQPPQDAEVDLSRTCTAQLSGGHTVHGYCQTR
jgi:hypothetical protein